MDDDDGPDHDVAIQVYKGSSGYGIYFAQQNGIISVTKLDEGSQAQMAGVQPKDILVSVRDMDCKLPASAPGAEVVVKDDNYQAALQLVREMKYCRLKFKSPLGAAF